MSATPAHAGEPSDDKAREAAPVASDVKVFLAADIEAVAIRADRVGPGSVSAQQSIGRHLDDEAREGRLIDLKELNVASLPDPHQPGEQIHVLWAGRKAPQEVTYAWADHGQGTGETAMGILLGDPSGVSSAANAQAPVASGFEGAKSWTSNMTEISDNNNCATVQWTPAYSYQYKHKMTSCYEKWKQSGTNHWIYNRWMKWSPGEPSIVGTTYRTWDLTIRSRPWSGLKSRLVDLNDWAPRIIYDDCNKIADVTIGGSHGGATGQITFPVHHCDDYRILEDANEFMIGVDYRRDDSVPWTCYTGQRGAMALDAAGDFDAANSSVVPVWADYNWAAMIHWNYLVGCATTSGISTFQYKDSGW